MSRPKAVNPPLKNATDAGPGQHPPTQLALCCEQIREAAYIKWEAAGCPHGDGIEFWLAAEAELLGDVCSEETVGK